MKVYVDYKDQDNSCGDPDCCGGPSPSPSVKVYSSREAARAAGLTKGHAARLTEVEVDNNEFVYID